MPWDLDSDRPVFAQLVERIQMDIVSGRYRPGERLPSVRELAAEAACLFTVYRSSDFPRV